VPSGLTMPVLILALLRQGVSPDVIDQAVRDVGDARLLTALAAIGGDATSFTQAVGFDLEWRP